MNNNLLERATLIYCYNNNIKKHTKEWNEIYQLIRKLIEIQEILDDINDNYGIEKDLL